MALLRCINSGLTVLDTSIARDLMRFSAGVQVYNEIPAEFLVQLDEDGP